MCAIRIQDSADFVSIAQNLKSYKNSINDFLAYFIWLSQAIISFYLYL